MAAGDQFVGRSAELEMLEAALRDAHEERGQIVLLAGEPGIGKTRTVIEFTTRAAMSNISVFWGRCHEEAGAPPYWPWTQILSASVAMLDDAEFEAALGPGAADITSILPEILDRIPDAERLPAPSDASAARFQFFSTVARLLIEISRRRVLVCILDDLHWADAPSLHLLEFLAQAMEGSRLLVIGTYRETEVSRRHRLTDTLGALGRLTHVRRRHVAGLGRQDVASFVTTAVGATPPVWLSSAIHEQTDGNPLFVREVVRFLSDQGYFAQLDVSTVKPTAIRLPEGVRDVIGRRLNKLSALCNEVLALAAVIGREFSLDVVQQASANRTSAGVMEALDEAVEARIVEEAGSGRFQFAHALVRITLYDELRVGQRRRLHHNVGEAVEFVHRRDLDPVLSDLAHHFRTSGLIEDAARAVDYAMRAALRADAAFAFEDAIIFYQNALDTLEGLGSDIGERRLRLLLLLGMEQRKISDFEAGLGTLDLAWQEARRLRLRTVMAEVAIAYAQTFWYGQVLTKVDARAAVLLEEALSVLPPNELNLHSKLLGELARRRLHSGTPDEARVIAQEAIAIARQSDDPITLAHSLACLTEIPWNPTETENELVAANEVVAAGHLANDHEVVLRGQFRRTALLLELGDTKGAIAAVDAMGSANAHMRQPVFIGFEQSIRASLALIGGDLVAVESRILEARDRSRKANITIEPLSILIFALQREQGRLKQIAPVVKAFTTQNAGGPIWKPGLALLYVALDELTEARAVFDEIAADDFAALPKDGRLGASLVYLAETCTALRDEARAAVLYRLLQPWEGRNVVMGGGTGFWGASGRYLGQMAGVLGNWRSAERHFAEALAMNTKVGARLQLAHTHHDFACMLLERGWPRDSKTAAGHLGSAARLAEELGLVALAEKVAACGNGFKPTTASPVGPDNLTGRELEVLRLLTIGRSNGDIATALGISQSTVASHVHNILSKTGCDNRTEAAAYATRNGLGAA